MEDSLLGAIPIFFNRRNLDERYAAGCYEKMSSYEVKCASYEYPVEGRGEEAG